MCHPIPPPPRQPPLSPQRKKARLEEEEEDGGGEKADKVRQRPAGVDRARRVLGTLLTLPLDEMPVDEAIDAVVGLVGGQE